MLHSHTSDRRSLPPGALWVTVFITGAEILAVEILGARLITPQFGVSLYVWSSLIAVTLIALALGYALGGWMADRRQAPGDLCLLLILAALALGAVPVLAGPVFSLTSDAGLRPGSLLSAGLLFTPPLIALAMITPYIVRLLARNPERMGRAVGGVYAVSTAGSVLGALATGFWLVPSLPLPRIFIGLALGLVVVAALLWMVDRQQRRWPTALLLVGTVIALWGGGSSPDSRAFSPRFHQLFAGQSLYGEWRVLETEDTNGTDTTRLLLLNGIIQSGIDRQGASVFPYSYLMERLLDAWHPAPQRVLLIGLGGGVMARSLHHGVAGSSMEIDVVEIDPMAVELAERYFGYRSGSGRLVLEDGRRLLNRLDRQYDAVILDTYAAEALPFHLLSREAFQSIRDRLEPGGVLLINDRELAARTASPGLLAVLRTLRDVFPVVELYASETGGALDSRFVVASMRSGQSGTRPDSVGVTLETGPFRGQPMTARVQSIDDRAGRLLTDAFNPMEWLDAPVAEAAREATRRYLR